MNIKEVVNFHYCTCLICNKVAVIYSCFHVAYREKRVGVDYNHCDPKAGGCDKRYFRCHEDKYEKTWITKASTAEIFQYFYEKMQKELEEVGEERWDKERAEEKRIEKEKYDKLPEDAPIKRFMRELDKAFKKED